ncbi:MAG: hypothetical protein ACLQU5_09265 [Isosphaeraceae bacterium]
MSNAETTDPATPSEDLAVPSVEDEPESRPGGVPLYVRVDSRRSSWRFRSGCSGAKARRPWKSCPG